MSERLLGKAHVYGDNIDTDRIIPGKYTKTLDLNELAAHCLEDLDPEFRARMQPGDWVVAGDNFGCGSSREHAPWALLDFGIRCVISTSFADIFFNNCFKNGILPVVLPQEAVDYLMDDARKGANARITVDLDSQTVRSSDGKTFAFEVDGFKKHCLMNGLDDIGLTLEKASAIDSFEAKNATLRPWA